MVNASSIGVFDSGVGGLSVLKELLKVLKENHVITHDDNGYTFHPEKLANAK